MQDYRTSHLAKGLLYDDAIAASPYDAYLDHHEQRILHRILQRLFPHGVDRSIDFACGTGRITAVVEPLARDSVGIDVSASMLDVAQRRCPRTVFLNVDITTQPAGVPPADLVTAFRFFGNAQPELRAAAMEALARLVKPDGYLVLNNHQNPLSIHHMLSRLLTRYPGRRYLTHAGLRRLLQRNGFEIVEAYAIATGLVSGRVGLPALTSSVDGAGLVPASHALVPFAPDAVIVARRPTMARA